MSEWVSLRNVYGEPVEFYVKREENGMYHGIAFVDDLTEEFLQENYPESIEEYHKNVDEIPEKLSNSIEGINDWVEANTYYKVRPFETYEDGEPVLKDEDME